MRGASGARRAFAAEIERLAGEFRGTLAHLDDTIGAGVAGEGLPPGLEPEVLFECINVSTQAPTGLGGENWEVRTVLILSRFISRR